MAKYVIEDTTLNNTANAIREKTGKTDKITPSNFATEIASIESGGGSSTVTKGLIINECDENGFVTDASVVGMTEIPSYYFMNMFGMDKCLFNDKTKLHLPENLKIIQKASFYSCPYLKLSSLPGEIIDIGSNAFYGCSQINISELPSGITILNAGVFRNCKAITELTCKGSISSIGKYGDAGTFDGCSNLAKLVFPNITELITLNDTRVFSGTKIASGTGYIYVPDALVDSFKSATNWSDYGDEIKPISELEASA